MKAILFASLLLLTISSNGQQNSNLLSTNFISLAIPQDYQGLISYLDSNNLIVQRKVTDVKHDNSILSSFPNLVSSVTLYQVDANGTLNLLGNSLTAKKSSYVVIYDYTQTQTIHLIDSADNVNYYALVGISVRMVARVNSKSAGINLANLFGLGVAANANKITGSLEVRANGINSSQINGVIPVTTDLSPSSIANALQAVATIKSHIYDDSTKITPQFLAFSIVGNSANGETKLDFKKLSKKVNALK